jgi:uncharacterized repeat protein (TIGR03803 family)
MTSRPTCSCNGFPGLPQNRSLRKRFTRGKAFVLSLLLLVLGTPKISAQGYADLFNFDGLANGCCPQYPSVLAQGRDGNLYGTTATGGTHRVGVVFKIGPSGGHTILHNFDTAHGSTPVGGLTLGPDGNLWGTTEEGGANGYGNIFRITPAGAFTVVYSFTGNADGGYPVSPLVIGSDGALHGTSYPGYYYKISTAGVFTPLGKIPTTSYGPLLQVKNGSWYGVTEYGGTHSAGTIYKITGASYTILHSFDGTTGSYPVGGLVQAYDGNFYGTTTAGGTWNAGVIYRMTPAGVFTVVVNFDSRKPALDGYQAFAGLINGSDGNLYGATIWGGQYGNGVIFQLTTDGTYTKLHDFYAPVGDGAYSTPMQHTNGEIYGMTSRGGTGHGVIYRFGDAIEPFVQLVNHTGVVGTTVEILGSGFAEATGVTFNGTPASFHVVSNTYMTAIVPSGETGFVTVETASGHLASNGLFIVTPMISGFTPAIGKVGDSLTITGTGLIQAINITVGGVKVTQYTVNSDKQLTTKVPAGAKTGRVVVATPGGVVVSSGLFTVTP